VVDRFFAGYRRGLTEPGYQPGPPAIVSRLRGGTVRARADFLAWGETQMEPMTDAGLKAVVSGLASFGEVIRRQKPELTRDYFALVRAGWLRIGVGSAVALKILIRIQGPSADPGDDELLEAKTVGALDDLPCLDTLPTTPTLRVILGNEQLGRLKHTILAAGPEVLTPKGLIEGEVLGNWWIRSWDPSYHEVRIRDLRSAEDLAGIAFDSGLQLGGGRLYRESPAVTESIRAEALTWLEGMEGRLRSQSLALVEDLLRGWRELRGR
jgi:hypothetical protein